MMTPEPADGTDRVLTKGSMMFPLRPMTSALVSFWSRGHPTERAAYVVGALLMVSGLTHLAIRMPPTPPEGR